MECPKCKKEMAKRRIKVQLWTCNKCDKIFTSYSKAYRHEKKCNVKKVCPIKNSQHSCCLEIKNKRKVE